MESKTDNVITQYSRKRKSFWFHESHVEISVASMENHFGKPVAKNKVSSRMGIMHKLKDKLMYRQECIRAVRDFFYDRGYCEVETPIAVKELIIDSCVSPWIAFEQLHLPENKSACFLQASSEQNLKRLLAQGMTSLFEIAHVFRAGESGERHHSEFLMLEWYGIDTDLDHQISLVESLVRSIYKTSQRWHEKNGLANNCIILSAEPFKRISYFELFHDYLNINPHRTSAKELELLAKKLGIAIPRNTIEIDDWLNLILTEFFEAKVLTEEPVFLYDYPTSQAALAKFGCDQHGHQVAKRFELYVHGVELCNGYHEQHEPHELESRMNHQNEMRIKQGEIPLPICSTLINEMKIYFPNCSGVALGLDRLIMLAGGYQKLNEVTAIPVVR